MAYFLLKTEPETFSFDDLKNKESEPWNGVRNYQARNYIRAMQIDDICLIYHSGKEKAVVGIAKVCSAPYQELENDLRWFCVDVSAVKEIVPFNLEQMKQHPELQELLLLRQGRLSVMPLSEQEFNILIGNNNPV